MIVLLFGATGMIGGGVLRECLLAADVDRVVTVVRTPTGLQHPRLQEIVHHDFTDFSKLADTFAACNACFFCLGVSSVGMSEDDYRRVTLDMPLAAARTLALASPGATFVYVSGAGADPTERGRVMWARVKGAAENALMRLPLDTYIIRPGFVQPMHGIRAKTPLYNAFYAITGPLYPLWRLLFGRHLTTTEQIGRAMLALAGRGAATRVLGNAEVNAVAGR